MKLALAALAALGLAGCSSATTSTGEPGGVPTPEAGPPAPGVPTPTGVVYRAVRDAAYTLQRRDSLSLQLPGGASQLQLIDRTAYVRVTLTPDTAGYQATIVLDSLQASEGGVPAVLDSLTPAWGTRWTARLTSDGELSAMTADRSSRLGDQVESDLRSLFPGLPSGGVQIGMEWTDTTEVPVKAAAFDAVERALIRYRAVNGGESGTRNAIRLESNGTYQRTGKRMQFEQQLEMTATGTRSAVHHLSREGILISAQGSDAGEMTITIPAQGQTVPVRQTGTYSITPLRQPKR